MAAVLVVAAAGSLITPKSCYSRHVPKQMAVLTWTLRRRGVAQIVTQFRLRALARLRLKINTVPISGIHTTSGSGEINMVQHRRV